MLDSLTDNNGSIREIVQEVLTDVIGSLSDTVTNNSVLETDEALKAMNGTDAQPANVEPAPIPEDTKVSNPIPEAPLQKVSAVPPTEQLGGSQNEAPIVPKVNNMPSTTDVNQTMGSYDAKPNTSIQNTRASSDVTPIDPMQPAPIDNITPTETITEGGATVNVSDFNAFGTSIVYSQNKDGQYDITFCKNGRYRKTILPSLSMDVILPELEDFLVEIMTDKVVDEISDKETSDESVDSATKADLPANPEPVEAVSPEDIPEVTPETEEAVPVTPDSEIEENAEDLESKNHDIISHVTMSSLRRQYADKIMEIFKLGLMTKNAIISESKGKFFARDKDEYIKKAYIISSEIKKKKRERDKLTKEYLELRKERDGIKNLVGVLSAAIKRSQKGLTDGHLTDENSEKIVAVLSSIVTRVVDSYGKENFSSVLASSLDHASRVRYLIATEVTQNKKKALISQKVKEAKAREAANRKTQKPIVSSRTTATKTKKVNNEEMRKSSILGHQGLMRRMPNVVMESNYIGRPADTLSGRSRHDGMDEMICEIVNLF